MYCKDLKLTYTGVYVSLRVYSKLPWKRHRRGHTASAVTHGNKSQGGGDNSWGRHVFLQRSPSDFLKTDGNATGYIVC